MMQKVQNNIANKGGNPGSKDTATQSGGVQAAKPAEPKAPAPEGRPLGPGTPPPKPQPPQGK